MSDKLSTTRISDLPENITMQMGGPVQPQQYMQQPINTRQPIDMADSEQNLTYSQMNVHPNPYGNQTQSMAMSVPQQPPQHIQQSMQGNGYLPPSYQMQTHETPKYKLPSRDIPRNTDDYMQDIEITPNYIPAPKLTSDYIRDFQEDDEKSIKAHKQKKHRERLIDKVLTEVQMPFFIGILFFIFQMPLIDMLIFKRFSFMRIYNEDGNFNFYGLFIKSILFGFSYTTLTKGLEIISSL
jgi:hypothetical protein